VRRELLVEADRLVAALPAGRRESIREIVIDAMGRGMLTDSSRAFLHRATGSTFLGDVLAAALEERAAGAGDPAVAAPDSRPELPDR
jgi:hypothetical protein